MTPEEFNRLLGRRKASKRKKLIESHPPVHPMRGKALGKSKGSKQGVAGWRTNYHRLDSVELATAIVRTFKNDDTV